MTTDLQSVEKSDCTLPVIGDFICETKPNFFLSAHIYFPNIYWVANVDEAEFNPPVCHKNVAQLVADKMITIDVGTLDLTLPELISELNSDNS